MSNTEQRNIIVDGGSLDHGNNAQGWLELYNELYIYIVINYILYIGRSATEKQRLSHILDTIMTVYVVMDMVDIIAQVHKL